MTRSCYKKKPIFSQNCPKLDAAVFTFKSDVVQIAQKVLKYFDSFVSKFVPMAFPIEPNLVTLTCPKIAQYGHTEVNRIHHSLDKSST